MNRPSTISAATGPAGFAANSASDGGPPATSSAAPSSSAGNRHRTGRRHRRADRARNRARQQRAAGVTKGADQREGATQSGVRLAAAGERRTERQGDADQSQRQAGGGARVPHFAEAEHPRQHEGEDRRRAHHQRHVGAGDQMGGDAEQQERPDLPGQRHRRHLSPDLGRSRPGDAARQRHRGERQRGDAGAAAGVADPVERLGGDLDQQEREAPQQREKGELKVGQGDSGPGRRLASKRGRRRQTAPGYPGAAAPV